jgi:hypothetical protein
MSAAFYFISLALAAVIEGAILPQGAAENSKEKTPTTIKISLADLLPAPSPTPPPSQVPQSPEPSSDSQRTPAAQPEVPPPNN